MRDLRGLQDNRQHAVLEAVVKEDVGEARGDEAAEPVVEQGPGRVLARGPTPKVVTRQQDRCALITGLVEKEVWVGRTIAAITPVREQPLAQARALDRLQVLLGNDLVGIHVHPVERGDEASEYGESIHRVSLL